MQSVIIFIIVFCLRYIHTYTYELNGIFFDGIHFIYRMQTLHDLCPDLDHPITNEDIQDLVYEQSECTLELLHLRSSQRNVLNLIDPLATMLFPNVEVYRIDDCAFVLT
jgi:hypothetical protein